MQPNGPFTTLWPLLLLNSELQSTDQSPLKTDFLSKIFMRCSCDTTSPHQFPIGWPAHESIVDEKCSIARRDPIQGPTLSHARDVGEAPADLILHDRPPTESS